MTDFAPAEIPLAIDRVHGSRPSAGEIRLAVSGAWHGTDGEPAQEPLLVVQVEGRRHRFPAERSDHVEGARGRWRATFSVPDWAEPRHEGQAALWIGDAVVPVPPLHGSHHAPPPPAAAAAASAEAGGPEGGVPLVEVESNESEARPADETRHAGHGSGVDRSVAPLAPGAGGSTPETPRSGPLADLLLRETVAALHGELERRTSEVASLRAAVGHARGELEARSETQGRLESTLSELSVELRRLMEVVEEQRAELEEHRTRAADTSDQLAELAAARTELAELRVALEARDDEVRHAREQAAAAQSEAQQHAHQITTLREELAASRVAREGALSEVAALQGEMNRIGAELAVTRERLSSESGDLGQAGRLLAEAKALADQLRRERDG